MSDLLRDLLDAVAETQAGSRTGGTFGRLSLAADAIRADHGEYRPEYDGWPNRETWNTALWIDNEQGSYATAHAIVTEAYANAEPYPSTDLNPKSRAAGERRARIYAASVALQEWWTEENDADSIDAIVGPISDAWSYALACVDWYRIAEGYAEDL